MIQAKELNSILDRTYGQNGCGEQLFRVVFSDNLTEKRFGIFREFYGPLFVREIRGLKEVPKYPHIRGRWILEKWFPPELVYTDEIPSTSHGSYEPLFVLQDDNYEPLQLCEEFVHAIIWHHNHPKLMGDRKSDLAEQERLELDQEVESNKEEIAEEGRTWIGHRLHSGEGIVRP